MSNSTTPQPVPHARDEELAAVGDAAVITIQSVAILLEIIISIPMIITLCRSYNRMYPKPNQGDIIAEDENYDNIKKIKLLHRGIVCTLMSIITYMAAGLFIIIQELHEAPWIVDHLVYIFLILSYTFIFVAVRNIGIQYFLTFINRYCNDHNMNNQNEPNLKDYSKEYIMHTVHFLLFIGLDISLLSLQIKIPIVTAIGLGHIYLAAITLHVKFVYTILYILCFLFIYR